MIGSLTNKNIATFFLILLSIQYLPLEGHGVSYFKFTAMLIAPILWAEISPKVSKAFIWGGFYMVAILFSTIYNIESFRLPTFGYKLSFFFMFITYYNLIYCEKAFTSNYFIKILKGLILAYTICLLLQQVAIIVGLRYLPIINLMGYLDRGLGANSLSMEPSHSARILTVLFLSLLRMYEVEWGKTNVTILKLFKETKWVFIGFLWSMLTMGSGTAFIGLAIVSLYFIKNEYVFIMIPLLVLFYIAIPYINVESLSRPKIALEATLTLDKQAVLDADGSAAVRILPLMNTLDLDFNNINTWLGSGIDTGFSLGMQSKEVTVGNINDYGLISYIFSLIFIITCCFKKILSLEVLIFIVMLGAGVGNIAYVWASLMLFTTSKYFLLNEK